MNAHDNRPVGIFDSGLGGLTSLKAIKALLPHEDLVFFGDTARVPYGNRTREELLRFSEQNIRFLQSKDVKAVVVACNTSDAMARAEVQKEFDLPIIGVIDPSARLAAEATLTGGVGVIGTHVTVTSGLFNLLIPLYNPLAQVTAVETPKLVPLVESGKTHETDAETVAVLNDYLAPFQNGAIDTLVLGCTHYPLLAELIGKLLPGVTLINSGAAAAQRLKDTLTQMDLLADRTGPGAARFYVSGDPDPFARNGGEFLGEDLTGRVQRQV
ncbi:MAG: glutamate racemase [Clostridia bacterium]|nr:glutamate racemase [Clostridia bacterium]